MGLVIDQSLFLYFRKFNIFIADGRIVLWKLAWIKAWNGNGPKDSIIDASEINLDPWFGKIEGIDYVTCIACGFKGKNITRHVKKEHGLDGYNGSLKSKTCINSLLEMTTLGMLFFFVYWIL